MTDAEGRSMKILWSLAMVLLISVPQNAQAFFTTGNELFEWGLEAQAAGSGSTTADYVKAQRFISYMSGVVDGIGLLSTTGMSTIRVCLPKSATIGQLSSIVMNYLRTHPETRRQAAATLVLAALLEAFACPNQADAGGVGYRTSGACS
jgi:hypothetical protein